MIGRLLALFARRPDPVAALARLNVPALLASVRDSGEASGRPRGLRWLAVEPTADPVPVWDGPSRLAALVSVEIRFEPVPGSDMDEVEAAHLPRQAVVVTRYDGRGWRADPKPLFNLDVSQVLHRSGGRFRLVGGG